jgi:hypothetical protein
MYTFEHDADTVFDPRPGTATKRVPAGGYRTKRQREEAQRILDNVPRHTRAAAYREPRSDVYEYEEEGDGPQRRRADEQAPNTREDEAIRVPRTRVKRYSPAPSQEPKRQKQPKPPIVYVGATAAALVGFLILSTSGASWWATHVSDPGTYGPTHSTIATGVLGGGDSKEHPTKIIGLNNDGKIELIILHANDPAKTQIINGPDLTAIDFPDPKNAEIDVQVGDYNHDGKQDVQVTIYATTFDMPFHRYNRPSILDGDGKGNLKPQQTGGQ